MWKAAEPLDLSRWACSLVRTLYRCWRGLSLGMAQEGAVFSGLKCRAVMVPLISVSKHTLTSADHSLVLQIDGVGGMGSRVYPWRHNR